MDVQEAKNDLTQLDKLTTQTSQVKTHEYKGLKGYKKIARNEKKKESKEEEPNMKGINNKDGNSDLEIVLQLQKQRPQSQYLRKKVASG